MFKGVIVLALVAVLAGCASSGAQIEQSAIDQLQIGQTTEAEMISQFGAPLAQHYSTEGHLTYTWHYNYVGPFGTGMEQQNLIAQFDDDGKLLRYNFSDGGPQGVRLGR